MNIEDFVLLNKELGHKILSFDNIDWLIRDDGVAFSLPSLEVFYPDVRSFKILFKQGVKLISFKTNIKIKNSFEYIFAGNDYNIEQFESKIRNQIRKALKSCTYRRPSINDLIETAFLINVKTMQRQKRFVKFLATSERWGKYIKILYNREDVEILGAYVNNELVAYSVFIKILDKYYIYHPFTNLEYSSYCPMNGILFNFINHILKEESDIQISYGLASYSDKPGLDKFKKGMLFTEVPVSRITVMDTFYNIIVNRYVYKLLCIINTFKKIATLEKFDFLIKSKLDLKEYYKMIK
jgi:hypothetical protein